MLDSRPAVAGAVGLRHVGKQVEHHRDGAVADGVDAQLLAGLVYRDEPGPHLVERLHLVGQEPADPGSVGVGLEELRGGRPERPVREPLRAAHLEERVRDAPHGPGRRRLASDTSAGTARIRVVSLPAAASST